MSRLKTFDKFGVQILLVAIQVLYRPLELFQCNQADIQFSVPWTLRRVDW